MPGACPSSGCGGTRPPRPEGRSPLTADAIAAELETSRRTVYRDIAALMAQRVPIRGEAGIGYVPDGGFEMPPLMLTSEEIEAVALGAQWGRPMPTRRWPGPPPT